MAGGRFLRTIRQLHKLSLSSKFPIGCSKPDRVQLYFMSPRVFAMFLLLLTYTSRTQPFANQN